ncbi:hypothetical protein LINGRAHAP2_LOCUS9176, partial [Linum grandiflorum]
ESEFLYFVIHRFDHNLTRYWISKNTILLRGLTIWDHSPPRSASWVWKKIMGCRVFLLPHITQDFYRDFLWDGVLMKKYSVSGVWSALRVRRDEVPW